MKNLKELSSYIANIPCTFGSNLQSGEIADFPAKKPSGNDSTNFETGFTPNYSSNPTSASGDYLLRKDMNRIGELATLELFFKKCGGVHTFSSQVSSSYGGYQKDICLGYYDGECLKKVKSEITSNTLDFKNTAYSIDCIPSGHQGVVWSTSSYIYGIDEGSLRMVVDFSNRNDLTAGEKLETDSLVVIGQAVHNTVADGNMSAMNATVSVYTESGVKTINLSNKGKCGLNAKVWGFLFWTYRYPDPMCGAANYSLAFFARKGWAVSASMTANGIDVSSGVGIFSYPVRTVVE